MKSKLLKSIGIAILCLAIVLGNVLAFSLGTTDGVWGRIDSTGTGTIDATCGGYGKSTSATYTMYDVAGVIYNTNVGPGGEDEVYTRKSTVCAGDLDGDMNWTNWTRTTTMDPTLLNSYTGCASTTGLIISKVYYDDRDNGTDRLGIQIYNGTGASVNLSGYSLLVFTNDRDFTKVDLTPTNNIASGGRYIVATYNFTDVTENQTFTANNDYRTIVLLKNYTYQSIDGVYFGAWPETVQDDSLTDENQVRYGRPETYGFCPNDAAGFELQSGFGFEGQENSNFEPAEGQYFPVGRFCHYNNPVWSASNKLDQVPLFLTINDVGCPTGQTYEPIPPVTTNDLTFEYRVNLVETPNTDPTCEYTPDDPGFPSYGDARPNRPGDLGPNRNGCADGVVWTAATNTQRFTCRIDATHAQEYTVSILGFTPITAGGVCPDVPVGTIQFNQIYTAETAKNCFCVYAAYTQGQITPVVLRNLAAVGVENGILISWDTVTETNNLGFNIMRAESVDGEQTQVNPELIMSELAPGDMFGAAYEYLDETAVAGVTYYYWLIDVPLDGSLPGIHGPISAIR